MDKKKEEKTITEKMIERALELIKKEHSEADMIDYVKYLIVQNQVNSKEE